MSGSGRVLSPRVLVHLMVVRPLVRIFFGLSVIGRGHLLEADRFILVSNHNSHLDVFLLLAALPARQIRRTHPVAATDYFSRNRLLHRVVQWLLEPVWIDRSGSARQVMARLEECLDAGENLILFPEGTRGEPGRLQEFKGGLGLVAEKHPDLPIVPAYLAGPEKALPRRSVVPVPVWNTLVVGPPQIYCGDRAGIVAAVREKIKALAAEAGTGTTSDRVRRQSTIAVLGIDGSGKSTLARSLARRLSAGGRTCHVGDRLEIFEEGSEARFQPIPSERIRRVVGDRAKRAGSLKRYKIPKLAELLLRDYLLKQARLWYRPDLVVLDGSPLLNLTAWAGLYRKELLSAADCAAALRILTSGGEAAASRDPIFSRFPELAALAGLGLATFDLPDAVILIDLDPAISMERIRSRGQEIQAHETTEKLERLRIGYLTVSEALRSTFDLPFLRLEGAADAASILEEAAAFVSRLRQGEAPGTDGKVQ